MKATDATGAWAGLDTVAEDIDHLKYYVGELKDLLSNSKGEVNHVRRIVHACEPDMEDFTSAMDATHSIYRPREPQSRFAGRVSLNHVSTGRVSLNHDSQAA